MNYLRRLVMVGGLAMSVIPALLAPAAAQSSYGCVGLSGRHNMPSVEGRNGVFYRIDPDLHMFHSISDQSIAQLGQLSRALSAIGTTLIYAPVPSRAVAMPDHLPQIARDFGFDADLATTVYIDSLRRLELAQIVTADVRRAMRTATTDALPFFATDPRLTPDGARLMSGAIAYAIGQSKGFDAWPKAQFSTQTGMSVTVPSAMRSKLQRHCMVNLPEIEAFEFATARTQAAILDTNSSIFGKKRGHSGYIALIGTDVSGSAVSNLAGFLSQDTGLDVQQYSVPDGGSFAAMSSYLTSEAFQNVRPAYLVWTNPITNNLAQYGDQPLRELSAAIAGNCPVSLRVSRGRDVNSLRVDLSRLDRRQSHTLYVDAAGAAATEARFEFVSRTGLVRRKIIVRHPEQIQTGRFYMPMSGLWQDGAIAVEISLDVPFGPTAHVSACIE